MTSRRSGCPDHDHHATRQASEGDDPLLAIVDAIINGAERQAFKHQLRISEIQATVRKVALRLARSKVISIANGVPTHKTGGQASLWVQERNVQGYLPPSFWHERLVAPRYIAPPVARVASEDAAGQSRRC